MTDDDMGRRKALFEKANELRLEWMRAENAASHVEELVAALRIAREYVASVHGQLASAMGHERTLVKPDLEKIDAVLAKVPK